MDALAEYNEKMRPFADIKGCAFKSYNWYKGGCDERVYEVGLKIELKQLGYVVHRQEVLPVYYKGVQTDVNLRMDIVVETPKIGNIICELKAVEYIDDKHRLQLFSYLRQTYTSYGMIINFSPSRGVYTEIWEFDPEMNNCFRITI